MRRISYRLMALGLASLTPILGFQFLTGETADLKAASTPRARTADRPLTDRTPFTPALLTSGAAGETVLCRLNSHRITRRYRKNQRKMKRTKTNRRPLGERRVSGEESRFPIFVEARQA